MKKILKGFTYAFKGLTYAFRTQVNFRIHIIVAMFVLPAGWFFKISASEWLWISLSIGLVLIFELLNTALETLVDLVSPEFNVKAGIVKDVSAAAVLVSAMLSVVIAAIIFIPKIFVLLTS